MIRENITLDEVIASLNEIYAADPEAMKLLIESRVPCNSELVDHPTVQCISFNNIHKVGILGVLNGIFGADERGIGAIAAHFTASGKLTGFVKAGPNVL